MTAERSVLCVDDDPRLLDGMQRSLFDVCRVETAVGGQAGLEKVRAEGPFDVVISDMRMPGMDGATFLSHVRRVAPDSVRVLLTGQTDLDAAIAAVNEGQIFRFLQKPCKAEQMRQALEACFRQRDLERAEKELLERTLQGAVRVLSETLALGCPSAGRRAAELKRYVDHVVGVLAPPDAWQISIAAHLSHLGCVAIPGDVVDRALADRPLSAAEKKLWADQGEVAFRLLHEVPRLEPVAEIVRQFRGSAAIEKTPTVELGVRLLRLAEEVHRLKQQGTSVAAAAHQLRGRYPDEVLDALATYPEARPPADRVLVTAKELRPGMVLDEDVRVRDGAVLVPAGHEITVALLERMRAFAESKRIDEPIAVLRHVGATRAP